MTFALFLYIAAIAFAFAMFEIQIEGKDGWAKNLPAWKIKNPLYWLTNRKYLDGYHTWLVVFTLLFFHLSYFFGLKLSLYSEFIILESYVLFIYMEDFLWFVLNPGWGIKKFFKDDIPWHGKKFLGLHRNYWLMLITLVLIELAKFILFNEVLWLHF